MTSSGRDRAAATVAGVAAVVPFVAATARAIGGDWYPIGDNAFFALRARDVFTEHHPLLGTWTSASLSVGENLNNPGPLLFDVLAVPAKLDPAAGLAIGVAVLNLGALALMALLAWRRGGAAAMSWAMAAGAALAWTMGSELLFDPWQPHALLFPFLAFLFAVWSMVEGDAVALPIAVGLASLIVQSHLSYAVLVPLLAVVGVVGLARVVRRDGAAVGRPVVAALAVAVACWAQPVVDQLAGTGNLLTLATNASSGEAKIGPGLGTQLVAWVLSVPPFWARSSFARALYVPGPETMPSKELAAMSLVAVVIVLAAAAWYGRRRPIVVVAIAAVLGAWVTTAMLPVGTLGIVPHQFKWLWPIGVFATFAVVRSLPWRLAWLGTAVAVALAALTVPAWNARSGPSADAESIPTARLLAERLELGEVREVLFDARGLRFAEPYSTVVLLELQQRGIAFRVDDAILARQVGESRLVDGRDPPLPRLVEREGDAALAPPPGAQVVALVRSLTTSEKAELDRLELLVAARILDTGLVLNERGLRVQRENGLPALREAGAELRDPAMLLGTAELIRIVREDLADLEPADRGTFERYAELRHAWNTRTVALFLLPPGAP